MSKRDWKARQVGEPEPGFFRMRLVRKGPIVPARIYHQRGVWWAVIDGQEYQAASDPAAAPRVFQIWHSGEEITEAEYLAELAKRQQPGALDRGKAIDLTKLPPIF